MSNKHIAAVDIGTSKTVTVVGERTDSGLIRIIGYGQAPSLGVSRGDVLSIQKALDSVNATIKAVNEQIENYPGIEGRYIRDVYVGISGQHVRCGDGCVRRIRTSPDSLITMEEINAMIEEAGNQEGEASGEETIHIIPQYYNVGEAMGQTDPLGMLGDEIEGYYRILSCKAFSAKNLRLVIKRAGLKMEKFILNAAASAEAILTDDEKEIGVASLDIGEGTADLAIYHDNILRYAAVIPFAGKSITEDIRQICGVSLKNAELMKRKHGICLSEFASDKTIGILGSNGEPIKKVPCKLLSCVIEARIGEIIATAKYLIDNTPYKDRLLAGMVLTGGTSRLPLIENMAKCITGMETVRRAVPDSGIIARNSVDEIFRPEASTAVGLIIKGFGMETGGYGENNDDEEDKFDRDLFGEKIEPEKEERPQQGPKKRGFIKDLKAGMKKFFDENEEDNKS